MGGGGKEAQCIFHKNDATNPRKCYIRFSSNSIRRIDEINFPNVDFIRPIWKLEGHRLEPSYLHSCLLCSTATVTTSETEF
jgi:hypothetical protein